MQNKEDVRKDIRMEIRFKNNLIFKKMESFGIESVQELYRKINKESSGVDLASLYNIINMKKPPINKNGEWAKPVMRMCKFFKCAPEELFSAEQMELALEKNKAVAEVSSDSIRVLLEWQQRELPSPEDAVAQQELKVLLNKALYNSPLSPRDRSIVEMRFGLDGCGERTCQEIATMVGVSVSRVAKIEREAVCKLRWQIPHDLLS